MKAMVQDRYGPPEVFRLRDLPIPRPKEGELLIRVHATSVTSSEAKMRQGLPWFGRIILGLFRPRRQVLGLEFAGVVEQVPVGRSRFSVGDRVFGFTGFRCGAYAEYLTIPQDASVIPIPEGIGFVQAVALVDGPTTAMFFLEKAKIRPGDRVLVNGASGSIGCAAIQLAKHQGAVVTAVCSAPNHTLVRALGAARTIDYRTQDFTREQGAWEVVFDTVGTSSFGDVLDSLTHDGRYLSTVLQTRTLVHWVASRIFHSQRAIFAMSVDKRRELEAVASLVAHGNHQPVIDRVYRLEDLALAHAYVDSGRKRGNVVVTLEEGDG